MIKNQPKISANLAIPSKKKRRKECEAVKTKQLSLLFGTCYLQSLLLNQFLVISFIR